MLTYHYIHISLSKCVQPVNASDFHYTDQMVHRLENHYFSSSFFFFSILFFYSHQSKPSFLVLAEIFIQLSFFNLSRNLYFIPFLTKNSNLLALRLIYYRSIIYLHNRPPRIISNYNPTYSYTHLII
jgi:hypothetical protein